MRERLRERDRAVLNVIRKKKKATFNEILHAVHWSSQSVHLALLYLRDIGLIEKRWEGRKCYYRIKRGR